MTGRDHDFDSIKAGGLVVGSTETGSLKPLQFRSFPDVCRAGLLSGHLGAVQIE